jgi:Lsr2
MRENPRLYRGTRTQSREISYAKPIECDYHQPDSTNERKPVMPRIGGEIRVLNDDLTGQTIASEPHTVKISVGDEPGTVELFLSDESLAALRGFANGDGPDALAALIAPSAASKPRGKRSGGKSAPGSGDVNKLAREWAATQGISVKDRGRVPADVLTGYQASLRTAVTAPAGGSARTAPAAPAVKFETDAK